MYTRVGERGSTLLDAVVGTALMLVVFVGIVGAFRLTVEAVSNNKSRAGAVALANERLEYIRSLSYDAVGTVGGIPSGALEQSTTTLLNDVSYTRRTFISYEDDAGDGLGGGDSNGIIADYKAVKVTVSWQSRQATRTITLVTRISPPGIESAVPGGLLTVSVVNSTAQPVANASVRIVNASVSPAIDLTTYTDSAGVANVIGAPAGSGYQVTVTKSGYSLAQTYSPNATNTDPLPAHLGVALNQTTAATFGIDLLATAHVRTYEPLAAATWSDSFSNMSRIAFSDHIDVSGGSAHLEDVDGVYESAGVVHSTPISAAYLHGWDELTWNDSTPAGTEIVYRVYNSAVEAPVPDSMLPGNSGGFTSSPIDLSNIATSTYPSIALVAEFSTSDTSVTPEMEDWSVTYNAGPAPLGPVSFAMRGAKTVGSGPGGLVYKYDLTHTTDSAGVAQINNVEWDSYTFSIPASTGYDIASACSPQPSVIPADSSVTTSLYLVPHTTHSLLVDVKSAGGATIPGATVRLYRGVYDTTKQSDSCGNAFYSNLSSGTPGGGNAYSIEVSASGYQTYTASDVSVSGTSRLSVILN